jgi:hypothetical protein
VHNLLEFRLPLPGEEALSNQCIDHRSAREGIADDRRVIQVP